MPFPRVMAFARGICRIFRQEGSLAIFMRIVRRIRLWPFATVHGRYRASLRLGVLTERRRQPSVIVYKTGGARTSMRNFLIDIEHHHQDLATMGYGAELIFAGNFEPGGFFSLATSVGDVSDVHVYASWERVVTEFSYFAGVPGGGDTHGITGPIDLDNYPEGLVRARFLTSHPYSGFNYAERKVPPPIADTLLWRQQMIVLNLPGRDRVFERVHDEWREFFDLVSAHDRSQQFLVVGQFRDLASQPSVNQKSGIIFAADLGVDLLGSLRAVRCARGYIGAFDEFGLMTIGTDVPALLLDPRQTAESVSSALGTPIITGNSTGQFMAESALTSRQVFEHYKRMVGHF